MRTTVNRRPAILDPAPRAAIFDLDGTLIDTLGDIAAAANHALESLGQPTHPLDAFRRMVGYGADVLMRLALPEDRADLADRGLALFKSHYAAHINERAYVYPGIGELLDELAARSMPIAVLSNKPDSNARPCIEQLLGRWNWAAIVGQRDDPGAPGRKPDPLAALRIAGQLGAAPAEVLFIGDSKIDMQTAVNAGMVPVGVTWGFRGAEELVPHGARLLLDHPGDLLEYLPLHDKELVRRQDSDL